jgi:hypothetical protein
LPCLNFFFFIYYYYYFVMHCNIGNYFIHYIITAMKEIQLEEKPSVSPF